MNAMEKSDNKCDCIHGLILLYFVYLHGFKFLIIHENSIKEIAQRQQIKTRWGYTNKLKTMITEMSISLDYTPRHLHIVCKKISIENMYVSTGYIIRYHYTEPILCKSPFTMTKFYRLHINMQFIRNICFKIKSYQFLLTISKLCNLNPYTAPLLALFMQFPMARMICTNTYSANHSFTLILCSAESITSLLTIQSQITMLSYFKCSFITK